MVDEPMHSVHTTSFPALLEQLGISVMVTTYQAGKLVMLRALDGTLNTHFRTFDKPMGLAIRDQRFALGTSQSIAEFHDVPSLAHRLEGRIDRCFVPRREHLTGDVLIHEMSFDDNDDLWFVNTRFSCLCTLDDVHSFVPRWRPPFVSALTPDDRCHLNGLAMRDGKPAFVTALGTSDCGGGWRDNKAFGGVLMDVPAGDVLVDGLSMPHSPRVHDNRLWLLNSGEGSLDEVSLATRRRQTVTKLPGFTRGLDFFGRYAFIGLSQVRESAVFSGIEITQRLEESERRCGIWVVDVVSGDTVAFVEFRDAVQEIFSVQVLQHSRCPDVINDRPDLIGSCYVSPEEALADVPRENLAAANGSATLAL